MAKERKPSCPDSEDLTGECDMEYYDVHNGSLYDIAPSKKGESYTVIFYTDQTNREIYVNYWKNSTHFKQIRITVL